jgi:hypothetical protein
MNISHDYTDFGPQIPFLGSEGLFSPLRPLKAYIFFIHIKFLITRYLSTKLILETKFRFWAGGPYFRVYDP